MYINIIKDVIQNWNQTQKCGFCWEFHAPLWVNTINNVQIKNTSAVQVMLVWNQDLLYDGNINYHPTMGTPEIVNNTENFTLYFLLPSNLDLNNYDEAEGHPLEEGRIWELAKLMDCLKESNILDYCNGLSVEYLLTRWQVYGIPQNFYDNNYIGFRVAVTLKNL